jgi:hypothetical protein
MVRRRHSGAAAVQQGARRKETGVRLPEVEAKTAECGSLANGVGGFRLQRGWAASENPAAVVVQPVASRSWKRERRQGSIKGVFGSPGEPRITISSHT